MSFKGGIFVGTQHSLKSAHLTHTYVHAHSFNCIQLFATPWIIASQASLSTEFSRQESWSGLTFLSTGDLLEVQTYLEHLSLLQIIVSIHCIDD